MSKKKRNTITTVTLYASRPEVHCPCCGVCPSSFDEVSEQMNLNPCPHTLFVADDEGFEYFSPAFREAMGIAPDIEPEDFEPDDVSFDEFTGSLIMPSAVRFAMYVPPPSFFGVYIGFEMSELLD